jgi:hypothetical protein
MNLLLQDYWGLLRGVSVANVAEQPPADREIDAPLALEAVGELDPGSVRPC